MPRSSFGVLTGRQTEFAISRGAELDSQRWVTDLSTNLFARLNPETERDLRAVGEISSDGVANRMRAPHSSTALAINTFDFWRDRDLTPLEDAIGIDLGPVLGFEQRHFFGQPKASQPDLCFLGSGTEHVSVEVKLREPYGPVSNEFRPSYFRNHIRLWDECPRLREHAERIESGKAVYTSLGAAQLIKHGLGLRRACPSGRTLVYYWYSDGSELADLHREELDGFTSAVSDDLDIRAITVSELLNGLTPDESTLEWHSYLTERYAG